MKDVNVYLELLIYELERPWEGIDMVNQNKYGSKGRQICLTFHNKQFKKAK